VRLGLPVEPCKNFAGPVVYDAEKCMGLPLLPAACPFRCPATKWNQRLPKMRKCDMCYDGRAGQATACAEVCPTGATKNGDHDQLLAEARQRIAEKPAVLRQDYGVKEVGGTSCSTSAVPFDQSACTRMCRWKPARSYLARARPDARHRVHGSVLLARLWITNRRGEVARKEGPRK